MLVVAGAAVPVSISRCTCAQARASTLGRQRRGQLGFAVASRAAASHEHAIRHGCLIARSPPGSATGSSDPTRRNERRSPSSSSPPQTVPSGPYPVPSKIAPSAGPGLAVLGQARRQVRVVVLDPDQLDAVEIERVFGRQVLGVQVVGDDLGLDREQRSEVLDPLGERAERLVVLEVADVVADPGPTSRAPGRTCS